MGRGTKPIRRLKCVEGSERLIFNTLRPEESLGCSYAKHTPLSEQSQHVILGGRATALDWPGHGIFLQLGRPGAALRTVGAQYWPFDPVGLRGSFRVSVSGNLGTRCREGNRPEQFVAFAPDSHFDSVAFGSELLTHDWAVTSLVAYTAALHRVRECTQWPRDKALLWIK